MVVRLTVKSFLIKSFSIILIAVLGIVVYSNSFQCSLHFDDRFFIKDNLVIRSLHLQDIWNFLPCRFVLYLSFALNYHFHQLDVFGYHIINLAVHMITAILVWWLALLTFTTPALKGNRINEQANIIALFAGLIFVTHPIQVEAVTYVLQRAASMATLFYVAALCFYVQSRLLQEKQSHQALGVGLYFCSLVAAVLAMFTKEIAITLPFVILFYEHCFLRTKKGMDWGKLAPLLLTVLIIPLTLFLAKSINAHELKNAVEGSGDVQVTQYLLTQMRVMFTYIRLAFLPLNQRLDYDYPIFNSFFELPVIVSFVGLIIILVFTLRLYTKYRVMTFFIVWFFLTLMPESSLFSMKDMIFEHRMYLPMVGFSIFLVSGVYYLLGNKFFPLLVIVLTLIIASNSVLTYQRNKVWKDDFTLWDDSVRKSPGKARPYNNRGVAYYKKNNLSLAMSDYMKAIELDPHFADPYTNLGASYNKRGDLTEAMKNYNKSLEIQPNDFNVYCNRAATYLRQEKLTEALLDYNKAIELDPHLVKAYAGRGHVLAKQGHILQAMADYDKAIELDSSYVYTFINRGGTYGLQGNMLKALADFNKAMEIDPNDADIYRNRGVLYFKQNNFTEAVKDYNKAILLNPDDAEVYYNRAVIYENQGNISQALSDYTKAIELNPRYVEAYDSRGVLYENQGKSEQALSDHNKAIEINSKYSKSYNNRGIVYGKQGDLVRALSDFNKAIEMDPSNPEAFYNRGLVFANQDKAEEALIDFSKAIEINPRYMEAYNSRGSLYLTQKKLTQAINDFNKLITLDPRYTKAHNNLGVICAQQGNLSQALGEFNKVIELDSRGAEGYHNRGLIYYNQAKFSEALGDFNKAIEFNPRYLEAYFNRAMTYYQLKDYDRAWVDVHKLQELGATISLDFLNILKQASGREQ